MFDLQRLEKRRKFEKIKRDWGSICACRTNTVLDMAEYIYDASILDSTAQVIVQQCHCIAKVKKAKGLAAEIIDRFPHADFYSSRSENSTPGKIEIKGGKAVGRIVCAFYSQIHPGEPGKKGDTAQDREAYFERCLRILSKVKGIREVAFPYKIGCGLAKGDWENYSTMIENFAEANEHIKVYIVSQDPESKGLDAAFIKWVCQELETNPERLREVPRFLERLQNEYHDYLHNVSEDDATLGISTNTLAAPEEADYNWNTTELYEYTENHTPEGWEEFFTEQLDPDCGSIYEISKYLSAEAQKGEIYPELPFVYHVFSIIKPKDIKVAIVGQDPYINPGEALGIAFSVPEGIAVPPSLRNIYKEMKDDGYTVKDTSNGDLTKWCRQGVFLINTALTVRAHESGSHSKKWNEHFTGQLMRWLNDNCEPLVVIMWGNHAQSFSKFFGDRHRKIMGVHPSPLSASRGFFGSKPFSKANKYLAALGHDPIDWSL